MSGEDTECPPLCDRTVPAACERCGQPVRAEHGHFKCNACGWLTHCCEGGAE